MKGKLKTRKSAIIIAAVIFITGIIVFCISWIHMPGIHFLFGFMHADVREDCYLYNPKEDKFLGQTEVTVKGGGNFITGKFNGEISVAGYEINGEPTHDIPMSMEDSILTILYVGITGKMEKNDEGTEYWMSDFSERNYIMYIDQKNTDGFSVSVGKEKEHIYAVHAVSEEKAREVFKKTVLRGHENVIWD